MPGTSLLGFGGPFRACRLVEMARRNVLQIACLLEIMQNFAS